MAYESVAVRNEKALDLIRRIRSKGCYLKVVDDTKIEVGPTAKVPTSLLVELAPRSADVVKQLRAGL